MRVIAISPSGSFRKWRSKYSALGGLGLYAKHSAQKSAQRFRSAGSGPPRPPAARERIREERRGEPVGSAGAGTSNVRVEASPTASVMAAPVVNECYFPSV